MKTRASDARRQKSLSLQLRTWRGRLDGSVAGGQKEKQEIDHTPAHVYSEYFQSVQNDGE